MTFKTGQDLIDEAKQQIEQVTPEQVRDNDRSGKAVVQSLAKERGGK